MSFSQLPNELLLLVAKSLSSQNNISALVRINWRLYYLLHPFLCQFNAQYHQGSGLLSAARNGNSSLIKRFLHVGTNIASFEPLCNDAYLGYERETQRNPLLLAAQNDHIETLEILLSETRPSRMCAVTAAHRATLGDWRWPSSYRRVDSQSPIRSFKPLGRLYGVRRSR